MLSFRNCSACGHELAPVFDVQDYPLITSAIPRGDDIPCRPLVLGACSGCGHIQLLLQPDDADLDIIYRDSYTSVVTRGTFGSADKMVDQAVDFLRFSRTQSTLSDSRILEIGCFDGSFLLRLAPAKEMVGCEPNPWAAEKAKIAGIRVIADYFHARHFTNEKFDLVILRHLIEHIREPARLLADIRSILPIGGQAMIETPRVEYTLSQKVIGNFYHQHLHYFTEHSLIKLLEASGFRVVARATSGFRQFVLAQATLQPLCEENSDAPGRQASQLGAYAAHLQKLCGSFQSWRKDHPGRLAIYGASSVATGLIHFCGIPPEDLAYLVDGDPRKHGHYLPASQAVVYPPERLASDPVSAVIIAADFFRDEILSILRRDFSNHVPTALTFHPEFTAHDLRT